MAHETKKTWPWMTRTARAKRTALYHNGVDSLSSPSSSPAEAPSDSSRAPTSAIAMI